MTFRAVYNSLVDRIMANISADPVTGCWEWQARIDRGGYARMNVREQGKHRTIKVHRKLFELVTGIVLTRCVELDHTCHNTKCVNPAHLRPVTGLENLNNRRGYRRVRGT